MMGFQKNLVGGWGELYISSYCLIFGIFCISQSPQTQRGQSNGTYPVIVLAIHSVSNGICEVPNGFVAVRRGVVTSCLNDQATEHGVFPHRRHRH